MNLKQLQERCDALLKLAAQTRKFGGPEVQWGDIERSIWYARELSGKGPVYDFLDEVLEAMDENQMIPVLVSAIAHEVEALSTALKAEGVTNG